MSNEIKNDDVFSALVQAFADDGKRVGEDRLCEYYLGKLTELDAIEDTVKAQYRRMLNEVESRRKAIQYVLGPQFRERVDQAIAATNGKKKSVNFLTGTAGYRKQPAKLVIEDEAAAIQWVMDTLGQFYIKTVQTVDKKRISDYVRETGDVPPGCKWVDEYDKFYPWYDTNLIEGNNNE